MLAEIRVFVHGVDGRVYEGDDAVVELIDPTGAGTTLVREADGLCHAGRVAPGPYRLMVRTGWLLAPERHVEVDREYEVSAYLGERGWPTYWLGDAYVPFAVPTNLLGIGFPLQVPDAGLARRIGTELMRTLDLHPLPIEGGDGFRHAEGSMWLFTGPSAHETGALEAARQILRDRGVETARVGVPVDTVPEQLKVIDDQVVVRFRPDVGPARAERLLGTVGAEVVREYRRRDTTTYVARIPVHPLEALVQLERWRAEELTVVGEPNIMAQIVSHPSGPSTARQDTLARHGVDTAWALLAAADPSHRFGDPQVVVATVDKGFRLSHPDLAGTLTNGEPRILATFDFVRYRPLTDPTYVPYSNHGMGVLGLIAARADNTLGVAGVAPNTRQICVERPDMTTDLYCEVLRWVAGLPSAATKLPAVWPAPVPRGADVLCCSHGSTLATSTLLKDAIEDLADADRVVVYSAGNKNAPLTGYQYCAWGKNIIVANTMGPDEEGPERRHPSSNYGRELLVCAQGEGAPSLDLSRAGPQIFGGTSAAAPIVAGVIALMRSAEPTLTVDQVRSILRDTAAPVDVTNKNKPGEWDHTVRPSFSQWYGYGRVNAGAAVERALR